MKECIENLARYFYDQMPYDGNGKKPEWVENGNSIKQDEARLMAMEVLKTKKTGSHMTKAKPQQESWRDRFESQFGAFAILGSMGRFYNGAFANEARISKAIDFISDERTQILNEVREVVEGMGTYRTAKNIETVNKHDLLQAIKKLKEEHE